MGNEVEIDPNSIHTKALARFIDVISEGRIEGLVDGAKTIYLNETPVRSPSDNSVNIEGVKYWQRKGTLTQSVIPNFPTAENTFSVGVELRTGEPIVRTLADPIDAVRVILKYPRGMSYTGRKTGDVTWTVSYFKIEIEQNDGQGYIPRFTGKLQGKQDSSFQISLRYEVDPEKAPYNVRVTNLSSTDDPFVIRDLEWDGYTEIVDAKFRYPRTALIGMQLNSREIGSAIPNRAYRVKGLRIKVPSNYDPVNRTYSGIWNGTFQTAYSNNPAWVLYDLMINDRYGLGKFIKAGNIDKWALYDIGVYCDEEVPNGFAGTEPRYVFNGVINERKEAWQVLQAISSMMQGMLYWSAGSITAVQDAPKASTKYVTRENVIDGEFLYSGTALKARHTVVNVAYNDENDFFRQKQLVVEDVEGILKWGVREKSIVAYGSTSRGQARRVGRWLLYTEKYESESLAYRAGLDHYDVRPGDIITVLDPLVAGVDFGGRLVAGTTTSVDLDKEVVLESGQSYTLYQTFPDGSVGEIPVTTAAGTHTTLNFAAIGEAPKPNSVWLLAGTNILPRKFRVIQNEQVEPNIFEVLALEHYDQKYAVIDEGADFEDEPYTTIPDGVLEPPSALRVQTLFYQRSDGSVDRALEISWVPSTDKRVDTYQLQIAPPDGQLKTVQDTGETSYRYSDAVEGIYRVRVRAKGTNPTIAGETLYSAWIQVYFDPGDDIDEDAPPEVSGLELVNANPGTTDEFNGRDAKFRWNHVSIYNLANPFEGPRGADSSNDDPLFDGYVIQVVDITTGEVVFTDWTKNNFYDFIYEKNAEIEGGPYRIFRFEVYARRTNGLLSLKPAYLVVSNPAPDLPTGLQIAGGVGGFFVQAFASDDLDWKGMLVWASLTSGYTPGPANEVADVEANAVSLQLESGDWYVRVAYYDAFGKTGLNITSEFAITVGSPSDVGDTIPPEVPTGLVLSTTVETADTGEQTVSLTATWDRNDVDGDFTYFEVGIREGNGSYINTLVGQPDSPTLPSYTWTVRANTQYTVRLRAWDYNGNESAYTVTATITSASDNVPPPAPTNFSLSASFKNFWLSWTNPSVNDFAHTEIWINTVNNSGTATLLGIAGGDEATVSGYSTGDQRFFWLKAVDTSGNTSGFSQGRNATLLGTATADYQDLSIVNAKIADATIDDAKIANLSADKILANTALAASVTVDGSALSSIKSDAELGAENPATRINQGTTQIDPGRITIDANTVLTDWRNGSDTTRIEGGRIAANTIAANAIKVGARNVGIKDIEFTAQGGTLTWTAGVINIIDDENNPAGFVIASGSTTSSGGVSKYVYWTYGETILRASTNRGDAYTSSNLVLAIYTGDANVITTYGGTIIDGDKIQTGTVNANRLRANTVIGNQIYVGPAQRIRLEGALNRISVSDGARDRVQLGLLNTGGYGIQIVDGAGKVVLSSAGRVNPRASVSQNMIYNGDYGIGDPGQKIPNILARYSNGDTVTWIMQSNSGLGGGGAASRQIRVTFDQTKSADCDLRFHDPSGVGDDFSGAEWGLLPVDPAETLQATGWYYGSGTANMWIDYYDGDENFTGAIKVAGSNFTANNTWVRLRFAHQLPTTGVKFVRLRYRIQSGSAGGFHYFGPITCAKVAFEKVTTANATTYIDNAAIDTAQINTAAITTAKIKDAAITNAKIANAAISNAKIVNAAITNAKIENLTVGTTKIQAGAITAHGSMFDSSVTTSLSNLSFYSNTLTISSSGSGDPQYLWFWFNAINSSSGTFNIPPNWNLQQNGSDVEQLKRGGPQGTTIVSGTRTFYRGGTCSYRLRVNGYYASATQVRFLLMQVKK